MKDQAARERIRSDFDTTLVVEAAAGTGKTTELVRRIAGLLRSGRARLERVVAVTFTDKAAGEMKLRLRAQLERERHAGSEEESQRLDLALEALETAHIGTIHSFCLDLVRERPVQARVDPSFEVVADNLPLIERAFDGWYQRKLDDPPPSLQRALASRRWGRGEGPRDMLLDAVQRLVERRDFAAPWQRPPFQREAAVDDLVGAIGELGALSERANSRYDKLAKAIATLATWSETIRARERARERDYDLLEYELTALSRDRDVWLAKGRGKFFGRDLPKDDVLEHRDALKAQLDVFVAGSEADLAAALQVELREVVDVYQELKARAGALDFLDMLLCVRDMLRRDPEVRRELGERFSHLFVDEFQDTDPLQAEILLLIASKDPAVADYRDVQPIAGKLFVVGDPKQAIYRFRRADVVLYQQVKEQLCRGGAEVLHLTTSFRSLPAIQGLVNQAFAPLMQARPDEPWQPEYVQLDRFREARSGQPAVVALPVPEPYSQYGNLSKDAIRTSEAQGVAAYIEWLVEKSGWTVMEQGAPVAIAARHVCLLFKAMHSWWSGDLTREYVRELEKRRIPHVLVGGRAYHSREEIVALRAALTAIEWPDDELAVYATLRGPLFSIGDDKLFVYRAEHGRLRPLANELDEGSDAEVVEALRILGSLHRRRNWRPIALTIAELLEVTRAHAGIAIWPTGEQALANLMRAMDEARRFEHAAATSFRAFVDFLEKQAERGSGVEAPVVEEGTDGVRIMTVHGAKGLEFPVVVLCELGQSRTFTRPSRWVDSKQSVWAFALAGCVPADLRDNSAQVLAQDAAESVRVGYVAATRAKDLLVVPVVGDARRSGWVDVLHEAIYPPPDEQRSAVRAPGCPDFGTDSVAYRPDRAKTQPEQSVLPGLHRTRAGGHGVVWWDPNVLRLNVAPIGGLRQTELLERDDAAYKGDEDHHAWKRRRRDAIDKGSRETISARTVTELAHSAGHTTHAGVEVRVEMTDVERDGRPHGSRFGSLVHAVLAVVPLDATHEAISLLARAHAVMAGATESERSAAIDAVDSTLRHPLWQRAAASKRCRRESPIAMFLDDGTLAEGVVDLAFEEEGRWHVIDFKTDVSAAGFAVYEVQVSLYVAAIAKATGAEASGYLLRV